VLTHCVAHALLPDVAGTMAELRQNGFARVLLIALCAAQPVLAVY
jgi:hypothetical protein